jgi:hypothetical protein
MELQSSSHDSPRAPLPAGKCITNPFATPQAGAAPDAAASAVICSASRFEQSPHHMN